MIFTQLFEAYIITPITKRSATLTRIADLFIKQDKTAGKSVFYTTFTFIFLKIPFPATQ